MTIFTGITVRAISPDGWPVDFQIDPGQTKTEEAINLLEKYGFTAASTAPAASGQSNGGSPMTINVPAESLVALVNDGKAYWKVKGGEYQKFGVSIWPEVLESCGFDVDNLNPLKPVNLRGWTAVCAVKEDGKAKKVLRLEKQEQHPTNQQPLTPKPVKSQELAADEDIDKDLFGSKPRQARPTEQSFRGRTVTSTAVASPPAPIQVDGSYVYRDGKPVAEEDISNFNLYHETVGTTPYSRENLINWIYK